jgi:hypothetical protein
MHFVFDDRKVDPLKLHEPRPIKLFFKNRFSLTTYERQSAEVMRIRDAWQRATIPRNVVAAFRSADLVPFEGGDGWRYLKFSKEETVKVHHWRNVPVFEEVTGDEGRRRVRLL